MKSSKSSKAAMTSLTETGQKRPRDDNEQEEILQCELCVEDFNCKERIPYLCDQCRNYPICEICYTKGCNLKPMKCPQCQSEVLKPDRYILRMVASFQRMKEMERELNNAKKNIRFNSAVPIQECLSLEKNSFPDMPCMICAVNFADAYCEDDNKEPSTQPFFLCNGCKPNRPIYQVQCPYT